MHDSQLPLIVGAGPVGLAAAVFLANDGVATRIVEAETRRPIQSRALAVNPRTLEILDAVGLTERMLAIGRRIKGGCLWRRDRVVMALDFAKLEAKYPFMLALSQAATQRLLEQKLTELGGTVERGTKLLDCQNESDCVAATLESSAARQIFRAPWLLAADGAHSTVREKLKIDFPGSAFRQKWELADVALDTDADQDYAHAFLLPGGEFQFIIRVVDPEIEPKVAGPLWRVIGNRPGVLDRLTIGRVIGEPIWASTFGISHRMNRALAIGRTYFAGDAAHLHSPIGARGMNLGIEDAWYFSELVRRGQMSRYEKLRYPIDREVVRRVAFISRLVACEPGILKILRSLLVPLVKLRPPSARMMAVLTGTGHPLGDFDPAANKTVAMSAADTVQVRR